MGLTEILQAMEHKANLQVEEVESAADKESRSIIVKAEEEARRIKEKQLGEAKERLRREQERLFSVAKLDRQRQLAAARETWLDRALAGAREQLRNFREGDTYASCLEGLTREALAEIGSEVKVEIDPLDEELMRRIMIALEIKGEMVPTLNTCGGLRASTLNGRISIDNTVEARLEQAWRELRPRLAALLTSEEVSCQSTTVTATPVSEL